MIMRAAFQHVNEVLKSVGQPLVPTVRPRSSTLALPLLKFSTALKKIKPMEPYEEDRKFVLFLRVLSFFLI